MSEESEDAPSAAARDERPEAEPEAPPEAAPGSAVGPPEGVEIMRVRGRGIAAIETDIPSSVTQFDAATIEALGAQDISDLSRVTPNVNIVQPGSTQATFFVRGIGLSDFSSNAAGAVAIFQDDVAINAPAIQTGQLFDVENVEIVRGPRGTGPFRNASAGAIRVRSRRPTGNYGAQLRSTLGRFAADGGKGAHHGLIQDYEGALEVPIVEDALSSRFAFRLRDAEPYKTNGCANAPPLEERPDLVRRPGAFDPGTIDICGERLPGMFPIAGTPFPPDTPLEDRKSRVPPGLPRRVGDEHNWAARGTFRLQPEGSESELFLNAHGSRLDQHATLGQAIGTRSAFPGQGLSSFGGAVGVTSSGYAEPDSQEEFERLCARPFPGAGSCTNTAAGEQLAHQLAEGRPLDIRPYRGDYDRVGQTTRDAWGSFLSGTTKLGGLDLFGLVSYDQYERTNDLDADFTPELLFEQVEGDEAWQTYSELRLRGELAAQPFEWEIGGFHLQEELDVGAVTFVHSGNQFVDIERDFSQEIQSLGLWGRFAWDFADDFTLEGGVRYNYEKKRFEYARTVVSYAKPRTPLEERTRQGDSAKQDATWQTPTGEIVLTYHIDDEISAYAKYTRGFKAGHFNALAQQELDAPPADEEYNDAWEAGVSGAWFDRRLSLLSAFFYYRYENYQVFLFTDAGNASAPPVLEILNARRAENYGIEVEGRVEPLRGWAPRLVEGLRLSGNFSWLHGEYLDFQQTRTFRTSSQSLQEVPVTVDYSGEQLQNSPDYKVSGTAEWTLDLGRFGFLIPRYDINWSYDVFFDPNGGRGTPGIFGQDSLPEYAIGQKAFTLHNVRLGYRTPTGNVEVAAWMRNVTDEVYRNFAFDVSLFSGVVINFLGEPRTVGLDMTVVF